MPVSSSRTWVLLAAAAAGLAGLALPGGAAPAPGPKGPGLPKTTAADRARSVKQLKEIGLALHNFEAAYGVFPAAAILDAKGKPLLSWRVALLPFFEEGALYKEFKLDEPWDSAHNKKLLAKLPKVYAPPAGVKTKEPHSTYYRVFYGPGAAFDPGRERHRGGWSGGLRIVDITDGCSNTLLAAEAGEPVPWTKPDELDYDAKKPLPKLGGLYPEGFHLLFADGSVRMAGRKVEEKALRALITRSGGEVGGGEDLPRPEKPKK